MHTFQVLSRKLLEVNFFLNVNTLGTEDRKAENMAIERADVEKAMAPHSSTLAWKIPWMEEPGGLQSDFIFTFHFSLSCIGEGNGNPLQCSCLENPRDGGAWRAVVFGVVQNRTRLKRLSSSRTPPYLKGQQCLHSPWGKARPLVFPSPSSGQSSLKRSFMRMGTYSLLQKILPIERW